MHEAKLCLTLLRMADEARAASGASRILGVRLRIGEWSGVAPEALRAAFSICAADTSARGAALEIETVPGREIMLCDLEVD